MWAGELTEHYRISQGFSPKGDCVWHLFPDLMMLFCLATHIYPNTSRSRCFTKDQLAKAEKKKRKRKEGRFIILFGSSRHFFLKFLQVTLRNGWFKQNYQNDSK